MPNKFVVFNGIDQNNLASLWITDGTSAGTSELSVTGASANGLNPHGFYPVWQRSGVRGHGRQWPQRFVGHGRHIRRNL